MATIQGVGGNCTLIGTGATTAFDAKLDAWSANLSTGIVQTSGFGDLGYRTHEATILRLSGSASGMVITEFAPVPVLALGATFLPASCKGTVTLTVSANHYYSFNALISNLTITRSEDGKCTVTFDFRSDGPVTQSSWS